MWRYLTTAGWNPYVVMARQDLEVVLVNLLTAPGHVGLLLVRDYLGGQHVPIVIGTTNIDGIVV